MGKYSHKVTWVSKDFVTMTVHVNAIHDTLENAMRKFGHVDNHAKLKTIQKYPCSANKKEIVINKFTDEEISKFSKVQLKRYETLTKQ